jgi:hypothetical protein
MTRKKRKKNYTPCFVFTLETISIAQRAMKLFEQSLQRVENQRAKVAFAEETMQQVNGKLDTMKISVGAICLTAFDYNEKIVLAAAIHLYIVDLLSVPSDTQRQRELQQCQQIKRFALDRLMVESVRTTHD